jgi:hypothetical protein
MDCNANFFTMADVTLQWGVCFYTVRIHVYQYGTLVSGGTACK